ncbi:hypothetical protein Krac_3269 [Ktedonobacter racemifer DSM 44963]|uniref:Uncharacterized protein n=1 Tax=Ktedonobacter racemifer DSM 44963 TaxID=485913 RepID=D6U0W7_KTERA|nr:hypothetical protein Krac_3269 [Ktedonobacter racemifer DSM 44963]
MYLLTASMANMAYLNPFVEFVPFLIYEYYAQRSARRVSCLSLIVNVVKKLINS